MQAADATNTPDCPQPIQEDYLLTGPLEPTNEPHGLAKIAGIKLYESYNRQYGHRYVSVMPTNLYGENDNYDLETSHVLPALIRKAYEAKLRGDSELVVWGTGTPQKLLDVGRIAALGWHARTNLQQGIQQAYAHFLRNAMTEHAAPWPASKQRCEIEKDQVFRGHSAAPRPVND